LFDRGLVTEERRPETSLSSPWYILGAQILGGWVAALFLLIFVLVSVGLTSELNESLTGLGAGIVLGCLIYYRIGENRQEFILQMVFAFSLCGQLILLWGIFDLLGSTNKTLVALIYASIFVIHWLAIPHRVNQFVAALGLVPSLLAILVINQLTLLILPVLVLFLLLTWLHCYRWPAHYQRIRLLGYATAINLLLVNLSLSEPGKMLAFPKVLTEFDATVSQYMTMVLTLLSALWLVQRIVKQLSADSVGDSGLSLSTITKISIMLAVIFVSLIAMVMNGLSAALLMLMLGYFYRELKLVVLSLCALLAFIGLYYYSLHINLFDKSLWLMGTGLVLLLARLSLSVWIAPREGTN
jgi:hypothetical protein